MKDTLKFLLRLNEAATLLAIHGLITDAQRHRIHLKLMKRKEQLPSGRGERRRDR